MAAIDIGPGADTVAVFGYDTGYTNIDATNPADGSGSITSFEVYAVTGSPLGGAKMGTFYGSGTDYTCRDFESIGTVNAGSKQTFSGLNCTVSSGDIIGIYHSSGSNPVRAIGSGGAFLQLAGDNTANGSQTYNGPYYTLKSCIYGTGETSSGWTGKINGVTNPAKIWGIAVANISKVGGI